MTLPYATYYIPDPHHSPEFRLRSYTDSRPRSRRGDVDETSVVRGRRSLASTGSLSRLCQTLPRSPSSPTSATSSVFTYDRPPPNGTLRVGPGAIYAHANYIGFHGPSLARKEALTASSTASRGYSARHARQPLAQVNTFKSPTAAAAGRAAAAAPPLSGFRAENSNYPAFYASPVTATHSNSYRYAPSVGGQISLDPNHQIYSDYRFFSSTPSYSPNPYSRSVSIRELGNNNNNNNSVKQKNLNYSHINGAFHPNAFDGDRSDRSLAGTSILRGHAHPAHAPQVFAISGYARPATPGVMFPAGGGFYAAPRPTPQMGTFPSPTPQMGSFAGAAPQMGTFVSSAPKSPGSVRSYRTVRSVRSEVSVVRPTSAMTWRKNRRFFIPLAATLALLVLCLILFAVLTWATNVFRSGAKES